MADDEVLLGHRGRGVGGAMPPILEADIAMASIAQDEIGHAVLWYSLLQELGWPDPDRMAYFRDPPEFRNATLVELPPGGLGLHGGPPVPFRLRGEGPPGGLDEQRLSAAGRRRRRRSAGRRPII
jgi:hypothetical protein